MAKCRGIRGRNKSFIVVADRGHYYLAREAFAASEEVSLALLDLGAPMEVAQRAFELSPTQYWVGEITTDGRVIQGFPDPDMPLLTFSLWWRNERHCVFSQMKWE